MKAFIKKHPFLATVILSLIPGGVIEIMVQMRWLVESLLKGNIGEGIEGFFGGLISGVIVFGGFLTLPLALTAAEILLLVKGGKDHELYQKGRIFDLACIVLGAFYSLLYLSFVNEVSFDKDWQEQLFNNQTHTPIYTGSWLTVAAVALLAVIGYLIVNFIALDKMPPLVLVLGMASMYLGTTECVVWGIQIFPDEIFDVYLLLFPFNCLLLTARTVRHKMWQWNQMVETDDFRRKQYLGGKGILHGCNSFLAKSERWPLTAFLLMWPLLGIILGILFLLGQEPDAVIKAFTETSDWNLSQRVAPQNIYYDEHYLCTVAAGGHEKVVKPKRLGVRHGHQVIVNRQLCVANAFEQVLEERTPRFHSAVRRFYDTYGFPVARLIHSKYTADIIYFLMKPLEWIFLIVLYLTDVNPENRIAIQYTGKSLADFERN